jgi:hypothetical protein
MPLRERKPLAGGKPRMGRDHYFAGGHSRELLLNAFSLEHEVLSREEGQAIRIRLINDKTGHNFPTDSRHRALDLILTFYKAGGLSFPPMDGDRPFSQEPGTYRMRFRNPYRSEGGENTQIPAGEEAVLEANLPEGAQKALIQVIYKLTPFMKDEEGTLLAEEEVIF